MISLVIYHNNSTFLPSTYISYILASCLYTVGLAMLTAGKMAPFSLALVVSRMSPFVIEDN